MGGVLVPYAPHGDVRIYYQDEGDGPPLVLIHGFGGSGAQFSFTGWVDALRDHYRLLAMDCRGHGQSSKPHEPAAYRMELRVGDITAVLDHLGLRQAHVLGYSSGGWIMWGMAKYAPDRAASLTVGGADADDPDPDHPSLWNERTKGLLRSGRAAFVAAYEESAQRELKTAQNPEALKAVLPKRVQLIAESDPEALIAQLTWEARECLHLSEVLPHLATPCLVFVGEADPAFKGAKAASALVPHAEFVSFPGLAHFEVALRADLLLPHLLPFLAEAERRRAG